MDDFGSRSTSLQPISSAPLPSKELSDVIVKAFDTAFNQFNTQNNYQTNNINGNLVGGLADTSISDYYKNLLKQSLEKEEKQKKKDAENEKKAKEEQRKREFAEYQKNIQTAMDELSKWANNPLQGVSDLIDNGFKKMFTGIQSVWNKPVAEIGPQLKETAGKLIRPIAVWGDVAAAVKGFSEVVKEKGEKLEKVDMDSLISGESGTSIEASGRITSKPIAISKEQSDKVAQVEKENKVQSSKQTAEIVAATSGVGMTVGGLFTQYVLPIVLGIGALVVLFPMIYEFFAGEFRKFIDYTLPLMNINTQEKIENFKVGLMNKLSEFSWPDSIIFGESAGKPIFGGGRFTDMNSEDRHTYVSNQKDIEKTQKRLDEYLKNPKLMEQASEGGAKTDAQKQKLIATQKERLKVMLNQNAALREKYNIYDPHFEQEKIAVEAQEKRDALFFTKAGQNVWDRRVAESYFYKQHPEASKGSFELSSEAAGFRIKSVKELEASSSYGDKALAAARAYREGIGTTTNNFYQRVIGGGSTSPVRASW